MTGSDHCLRPEKPSDRSADGMAETPRRQVSRRESGGYVSRRGENSDWRWLTRSKPPAASYPQELRSKSAFRLDAAEMLEFGRQQPAAEDQPARQSFGPLSSSAGWRRETATRSMGHRRGKPRCDNPQTRV